MQESLCRHFLMGIRKKIKQKTGVKENKPVEMAAVFKYTI